MGLSLGCNPPRLNYKLTFQAEIDRVEKLVAKMQKKNALLADDDEETEADEDKEVDGKKEPLHSAYWTLTHMPCLLHIALPRMS